jgi:hypothetical protein
VGNQAYYTEVGEKAIDDWIVDKDGLLSQAERVIVGNPLLACS